MKFAVVHSSRLRSDDEQEGIQAVTVFNAAPEAKSVVAVLAIDEAEARP